MIAALASFLRTLLARRRAAPRSDASPEDEPRAARRDLAGLRILAVDDDASTREMLQQVFENAGAEVAVDPNRLTSEGFGLEKPIAPNDTEEGRKENRRVEFHIEETP